MLASLSWTAGPKRTETVAMPAQDEPMTLTFRCPVEVEGRIPPPVPASLGLPDWLKAMPQQSFNALGHQDTRRSSAARRSSTP